MSVTGGERPRPSQTSGGRAVDPSPGRAEDDVAGQFRGFGEQLRRDLEALRAWLTEVTARVAEHPLQPAGGRDEQQVRLLRGDAVAMRDAPGQEDDAALAQLVLLLVGPDQR